MPGATKHPNNSKNDDCIMLYILKPIMVTENHTELYLLLHCVEKCASIITSFKYLDAVLYPVNA